MLSSGEEGQSPDISSLPYPALHSAQFSRWLKPSWYGALLLTTSVWSVTPVSWIWCAWRTARLVVGHTTLGPLAQPLLGWYTVLDVVAVSEVLFSVFHTYLRFAVQKTGPARYIEESTIAALEKLFCMILDAGMGSNSLSTAGNEISDSISGPSKDDSSESAASDDLTVDGVVDTNERRPVLDYFDPRAIAYRQKLRIWFSHRPITDLTADSIRVWLSWSLFSTDYTPDSFSPSQKKILEETLLLLEGRCGYKFPAHVGPSKKPLKIRRLTLDRVNTVSHPLVYYGLVGFLNAMFELVFKKVYGFESFEMERLNEKDEYYKLRYLVRKPNGWSPKGGKTPVVFIHGLGLGLTQYSVLIRKFCMNISSPILIPLQPHISMNLLNPLHLDPPSNLQIVTCLKEAIDLNFGPGKGTAVNSESGREVRDGSVKVTLFSHSNGSVYHSQFLREFPDMVERNIFADPVVFCLWQGDVCYNFCHRAPSDGLSLLMQYFVGSEIGISHYIARRFDWTINTLFFSEIANGKDHTKCLFMLGGRDFIVDAPSVAEYLKSEGLTKGLVYLETKTHGEALIGGGEGLEIVLEWLKNNIE